ncbi:hypothetical protein [Chondromyces crocatus]|uniref:hypothetical protein n=1 Tax=Chondromyces crocatus TaxID=52 RepID=UPI00067DD98F|nr:hypothetical protein [Chondromyces crocatus]
MLISSITLLTIASLITASLITASLITASLITASLIGLMRQSAGCDEATVDKGAYSSALCTVPVPKELSAGALCAPLDRGSMRRLAADVGACLGAFVDVMADDACQQAAALPERLLSPARA